MIQGCATLMPVRAGGVQPGAVIEMTYVLTVVDGTTRVGFGAGVYDDAGYDHSNGDDDRWDEPVQHGTNTLTRFVILRDDLPIGNYTLAGEVWRAGKIGIGDPRAEGECGEALVGGVPPTTTTPASTVTATTEPPASTDPTTTSVSVVPTTVHTSTSVVVVDPPPSSTTSAGGGGVLPTSSAGVGSTTEAPSTVPTETAPPPTESAVASEAPGGSSPPTATSPPEDPSGGGKTSASKWMARGGFVVLCSGVAVFVFLRQARIRAYLRANGRAVFKTPRFMAQRPRKRHRCGSWCLPRMDCELRTRRHASTRACECSPGIGGLVFLMN